MGTWGLAAAKARLTEVVECAQTKGVQEITRNGKLVGLLVSPEDWEKRAHPTISKNARTMSEFFRRSPLVGSGIDLRRSKSGPRKIEL